ncbi:MAG: hypothetical protein V4629_04785 [Pseudomonadota bacterium]
MEKIIENKESYSEFYAESYEKLLEGTKGCFVNSDNQKIDFSDHDCCSLIHTAIDSMREDLNSKENGDEGKYETSSIKQDDKKPTGQTNAALSNPSADKDEQYICKQLRNFIIRPTVKFSMDVSEGKTLEIIQRPADKCFSNLVDKYKKNGSEEFWKHASNAYSMEMSIKNNDGSEEKYIFGRSAKNSGPVGSDTDITTNNIKNSITFLHGARNRFLGLHLDSEFSFYHSIVTAQDVDFLKAKANDAEAMCNNNPRDLNQGQNQSEAQSVAMTLLSLQTIPSRRGFGNENRMSSIKNIGNHIRNFPSGVFKSQKSMSNEFRLGKSYFINIKVSADPIAQPIMKFKILKSAGRLLYKSAHKARIKLNNQYAERDLTRALKELGQDRRVELKLPATLENINWESIKNNVNENFADLYSSAEKKAFDWLSIQHTGRCVNGRILHREDSAIELLILYAGYCKLTGTIPNFQCKSGKDRTPFMVCVHAMALTHMEDLKVGSELDKIKSFNVQRSYNVKRILGEQHEVFVRGYDELYRAIASTVALASTGSANLQTHPPHKALMKILESLKQKTT